MFISSRCTLPAFAAAVTTLIMATTAACNKTPAHAAPVAKSMPAEPMAGSKMDGMMNHDGMKHMEGMSMTGDPDYDFAVNMRKHHQMAIDMAQVQLSNGKDPQALQMARDIIAAQQKEIAAFDEWVAAHRKAMDEAQPKS